MTEFFIASGLVIAFCIGWLIGDDHGRNTTNRQWAGWAERQHQAQWPKRKTNP